MTGKSALVLAGGGLTGAVYEMGALCAIDDLLVDRTVNDFDIFVGTSAGSLIAAMLANGMSPRTMLQGLNDSHPVLPAIDRRDLLSLDRRGILSSSVRLPQTLLRAWLHYLTERGEATLFDLVWSLSDILPAGIYDPLALERYMRQVLTYRQYSNCFGDLQRSLYIIATSLETGDRAVFGCGYHERVPISLAIAASSALPLVYKPVEIDGLEYVDGGLRGNASLDLAIEQGATLVVCINPVVPFIGPRPEAEGNSISDKGLREVLAQSMSIMLHSGLHYHIKQLRRRHPDVDIIVIEPRADDEKLHFDNIMQYSARLRVAQHGFESVTLDLARDFADYKAVLARHNIPVSRRLLVEEMQALEASNRAPEVLQRILFTESRSREETSTPVERLGETLAKLDLLLERMAPEQRVGGSSITPPPNPLRSNGDQRSFSHPS